MSSAVVDIAEAMVTAINSESWTQEFTAVRSYRPSYDLKGLKTMRVPVVAASAEFALLDRQGQKANPAVDVGVLKKIAATEEADILSEIDGYMSTVQEIIDFFLGRQVEGYTCVAVANDPIYSPDHLDRFNQFTSVSRFTFLGRR